MSFSETLVKMYWWSCDLCAKEVIMLEREQGDESCLCTKCIITELKAESMLYEMQR